MRKLQRRAWGLAALAVLVAMAAGMSANAGPIKLPRVPPDPPMIGDPDSPGGAPRLRTKTVYPEQLAVVIPGLLGRPIVIVLNVRLERIRVTRNP